jgi:hypothetical protein
MNPWIIAKTKLKAKLNRLGAPELAVVGCHQRHWGMSSSYALPHFLQIINLALNFVNRILKISE